MDPVSQALLGAACAQALARRQSLAAAAVVGAFSGLAADVDVFIRSTNDPLLALEYHRHFTHALVFIPVGGLLCALIFYGLFGRRCGLVFKAVWLWATAAYASHGLLDACTSYGTQLFWPFTDWRVSFDIISVIDPLFTLPLALAVVVAAFRRSKVWVAVGGLWVLCYLGLGGLQHARATGMGQDIAAERGHRPQRLTAKPSFANLMVWKVIYQAEGRFYVLAVRPGLSVDYMWPGESRALLQTKRDLPWLGHNSQQAQDLQRFSWFSDGYVAQAQEDPLQVVDIRYSLLPDQIAPLWGIRLNPAAADHTHVDYFTERDDRGAAASRLWQMISSPQQASGRQMR